MSLFKWNGDNAFREQITINENAKLQKKFNKLQFMIEYKINIKISIPFGKNSCQELILDNITYFLSQKLWNDYSH